MKDRIEIRDELSMKVLLDHDVISGANITRSIRKLCENRSGGMELKKLYQ